MITEKQFREIRKYKGLSLRDLAKFCTYCPQTISNIENGKQKFSPDSYKELIDALNKASAAKDRGELTKKPPFGNKLKK